MGSIKRSRRKNKGNGRMLKAALGYAKRDIPVLPLDGKRPRTRHGVKDATTDRKQIKKWWSLWPDANIGVACGAASGILALDIDPRNGGRESFLRLLRDLGLTHSFPKSVIVETGRGDGGFHVWLRFPKEKIRRFKWDDYPGIDVIGEGRYVVARPSKHPDTGYEYRFRDKRSLDEIDMKAVPDPLLDFLCTAEKKKTDSAKKAFNPLKGFDKGERDDGITKYAWDLVKKGCSKAEAVVLVLKCAAECRPPFSEELAVSKVESAWRKIHKEQACGQIISATDLVRKKLPRPSFTISGVLSEGLGLLSAKPKVGKSTLARDMAYGVSSGKPFCEWFEVKKGSVLVLSLDEGERATRQYLKKMSNGDKMPKNLHFVFEWSRGDQALRDLENWLKKQKNPRLIVIDCLQSIRADQKKSEGSYAYDFKSVAALRALAARYPGVTILVLHHDRKSAADNHQDRASGTTGLTGGTDCNMSLSRTRGKNYCTLETSGRLIAESQHVFVLDENSMRFSYRDPSTFLLSESRREIIQLLESNYPDYLTPTEIAKELGKNSVRKLLCDMISDGLILREGRGKYKAVPKKNEEE